MTDQEIVQALRCCADYSCNAKCPAFPAGLDCREEMHKEVLALIERLTAENAAPCWNGRGASTLGNRPVST
nr:MAG TPA: hypothetical protein [Caudoviricetes sp.]